MTHVRILTTDGSVDSGSISLPFVPDVGDLLVWSECGVSGWFRVVSRWLYCYPDFPSATLTVERCEGPPDA